MDKVIIIKSMTNFCYHIFQEEKLLQKKTKKKKKNTLLAKHTPSVHLIVIYAYGLT